MGEVLMADYNEVLQHDLLGDLTPVEYRVFHHPETSSTNFSYFDSRATPELIGPAQVLDVRKKASINKVFYKTASDHLPIVGRFFRNGPDDD